MVFGTDIFNEGGGGGGVGREDLSRTYDRPLGPSMRGGKMKELMI